MKKRINKLISSLLILAVLISCFSVFVFASTPAAESENSVTEDDITLLVNRTYDEGWNYLNGFTGSSGANKFTIDYEETEDFDYNYFCRIESVDGTKAYMDFQYGNNSIQYGNTVFELDLKTDDICNFTADAKDSDTRPIIYLLNDNKKVCALAGIVNNKLSLSAAGVVNEKVYPTLEVGSLDSEWVHLAFVATVNQRKCECGKVYTMTPDIRDGDYLCCLETTEEVDEETGETKEVVTGGVTPAKMSRMVTVRVYYGFSDSFNPASAVASPKKAKDIDLENTYYYDITLEGVANFRSFHVGLPKNSATRGQSYLIDNVKAYNDSAIPGVKVSGYGVKVDESAAKTETIITSGSGKTVMEYINTGVVMKVGSDFNLVNGKRTPIFEVDGKAYGAPIKVDGEVYVPLQPILDWVGYPLYQHDDGVSFDIATESGSTFITIGRSTATASGETVALSAAPRILKDAETEEEFIVISKNDVEVLVPGYFVTYDEMGLIVVSTGGNLFNRSSDLELMLDVMKRFIFDDKSGDEIYESVKLNTNNFAHPYLFANQDDFDALNLAYRLQEGDEGYDANLKNYLVSVMADAEEIYVKYANTDDVIASTKVYLKEEIVNPYANVSSKLSNNGYDYYTGGNDDLVAYAEEIRLLALAYQITGDIKYACIAYEMAVDLSEWDHWAPAYFINCADATAAYATAYDWLYNVWTSEECKFDVTIIEAAIYQKGIYIGNIFTSGDTINDEINSNQGVFAVYTEATDTWNVVGTSGMVIASLALIGSDFVRSADGEADTDAMLHIKNLLVSNIKTLTDKGLDAYAPDGSFIQSPEYWSYSTGALIRMIWALESSVGNSFGLANLWGLDNTFYYAYQLEYKVAPNENNTQGYDYWNYHESALGVLNTDTFFYAAEILGDDVIGAIRAEQLATKNVTLWDVLSYDARYTNVDVASANISRDYFLESCDGFVSRSDFSDKAVYVGMMGGMNDSHTGQIDSGNFIYASGGFTWFGDLGSDTKLLYQYLNDDHRYNYYRITGEGNNVVLITTASLANQFPYGQTLSAGGVFTEYYTEDNGMYAILDNADLYTGKVNSARRGILFTNNRSTVVIQDDIRFNSAQACTWVAHSAAESIVLSEDARTAYMIQNVNGRETYLRVTLLEPGDADGLYFQKVSTKESILTTTYKYNHSTLAGYAPENDRSNFQRLVIKQSEQTSFQCAVVIETIEKLNSSKPVEYEYTGIDSWNSGMIKESFEASQNNDDRLTTPIVTDIITYTLEARGYIDNSRAFTVRFKEFFRAMVNIASIIKTYEPTGEIGTVDNGEMTGLDACDEYREYLVKFDYFRDDINSYIANTQAIGTYITGFN